MTSDRFSPSDLYAIAHQAMLDAGFAPDPPPDVAAEVRALDEQQQLRAAPNVRDLRSLPWSSIDNPDSRDLDQVEVAQRQPNGDIQVLIGIADVDAFVPAASATDRHAAENTTSVYAGIATFPMLPERLSTNLTSLLEGMDRLALVIELLVSPDGEVRSSDFYRAIVRNHARLDYDSAGAWLESQGPPPTALARLPELADQLRLQDEAAGRLQALRQRNGALDLETIEATPVTVDGKVVDLTLKRKNRARYLIENFMVAANSAMASFLEAQGSPAIQRVVREPERWPRIVEIAARLGERLPAEPDSRALEAFLTRRQQADPERFPDLSLAVVKLLGTGEYTVVAPGAEHAGHFGLAANAYTHSTAPNRRYADLVTQRLLKAVIDGHPAPYAAADLAAIAERCNERQKAARKVELRMRKVLAAALLGGRVGQVFDAIVTGVKPHATYVRLIAPPVEGRVVRGEGGLDVGDKLRVRLVATEPEKGFIDFERAA